MSEKVTNRNRAVLDAALRLAALRGYRNITRQQVADEAQVAVGSVNNAFGTMDGLRDAVMAAAVAGERYEIIAQGLADRHPATTNLPPSVRQQAFASLAA
jgi:AcrR family transcriptional regulator